MIIVRCRIAFMKRIGNQVFFSEFSPTERTVVMVPGAAISLIAFPLQRYPLEVILLTVKSPVVCQGSLRNQASPQRFSVRASWGHSRCAMSIGISSSSAEISSALPSASRNMTNRLSPGPWRPGPQNIGTRSADK